MIEPITNRAGGIAVGPQEHASPGRRRDAPAATSGRLGERTPLARRELDQPTAERFERGRSIVVLRVLRVAGHRVDEPVSGPLPALDQAPRLGRGPVLKLSLGRWALS